MTIMFFASLLLRLVALGLLTILAVIDHKRYLLPDVYVLPLAIAFYLIHAAHGFALLTPVDMFWGMVVGGGFLLLIRQAGLWIMKEDAVGFGDIKFMAACGIGLGYPGILIALTLGGFFGILHGALLKFFITRKTGIKQDLYRVNVPAGVGFALGVFVTFIYLFGISPAV